MTQVWVVTVGVYSDARVRAVFSDEMAAITYCRKWTDARWEPFELDEGPELESFDRADCPRVFVVSDRWLEDEAGVRRWYNDEGPSESWESDLRYPPGAPCIDVHPYRQQYAQIWLYCSDPNPVRARKIFTEQRAMLLANWAVIVEKARRDGPL